MRALGHVGHVTDSFINMLFISTGIFDDKLRPQILSVGTTANSPLSELKIYLNLILNKCCYTILSIFRHLTKEHNVKGIKLFISGLTYARGSNQPFRSNIAFLSSRADIQTFQI